MRIRTLPAATALAVLFSSAALAATTPAYADSSKILPVSSAGDIVVDSAHQRVFVSDPTGGKIVVTDYRGTVVQQLTALPGVAGLELSADSATLYAAVGGDDAIVAVDTATGTESARYAVGDQPRSVAVAGDRIWFGYGASGYGDLGSVDLTGEQPVITLGQATRSWYGAPLLDAAPDSGMLLAGETASSPSSLVSYDVTTGAPVRLAATTAGSFIRDVAVTPDGQNVITASGSPYHHPVFKTADLTANGSYASDAYPNAVAIAPDGTVAAGIDGWYDPDVYIYRPGATTTVREYDFPNTGSTSGSDVLAASGLAWTTDASRLFAVTSNSNDVFSLRVLTSPTKAATAVTVDAPATAPRAKKLTVKGKVTSKVPLPAGSPLTVTRTDLESKSGKQLPAATVKSDGTYSFTDTPTVGGKVTYKVAYAGDAGHTAGSGSDSVDVSRAKPALTLTNNGKVYSYGADVKFTAHLGTTYKNRKVEIWADPFGGDKPNKLVKSGTVNSGGNLSVTLDLKRDTKVTAKFAGDARYQPRSASSTVGARVKVSTAVSGQYKKKSTWGHTYHFFRKSKDPLFTTTMSAYPGRKQRLALQVYYDGHWYGAGSDYFALSSTGVSKVWLGGTHDTGWRFRVRSSYVNGSSGDTVNSTTHSAWKYFTFTS
ncbi:Ig-like domain repeat protein [Streptomyces shenzhenensis]|uniref:Ig-like domain repeat protein n=1 Tax=Streptomyces shenzhenensis TaxID=943815 RepID=UPI0033CBD870